jgi:serine/threonine-protein kinase RsbW
VNERRIVVAGEPSQLPMLTLFLREFWAAAALPPATAHAFEIALEEIFINVATHGAPAAGRPPRVEVGLRHDGEELTLLIEDDGPAFNPLTLPAPDVHARLEDRRVGGLGVYLVRQMMDAVSYERAGSCNRLRLRKRVALGGIANAGRGTFG